MHRTWVLLSLLLTGVVHAQSTKPAGTLADGEVRYLLPASESWQPVPLPEGHDNRQVVFKHAAGHSMLTLATTEQKSPIPNNADTRVQLARQLVKAIRADLEKSETEILDPPKHDVAERFSITIRDRIRQADGTVVNRLHVYRPLGYQLLRCSARTDNQTDAEVEQTFAAAQTLISSCTIGKRSRRPATARSGGS